MKINSSEKPRLLTGGESMAVDSIIQKSLRPFGHNSEPYAYEFNDGRVVIYFYNLNMKFLLNNDGSFKKL